MKSEGVERKHAEEKSGEGRAMKSVEFIYW